MFLFIVLFIIFLCFNPAWGQQPETCDDRLARTAIWVELVNQSRSQNEATAARLISQLQKQIAELERAAAAKAKEAPEKPKIELNRK
jgi:hypothetical protein